MRFNSKVTNNVPKTANYIKGKSFGPLDRAVMKGGGLVKNDATSAISSYRGGSRAIKVLRRTKDQPEAHVGIKRAKKGEKTPWYLKFIDSGTKKHTIKPKKPGGQLWFSVAAGKVQFESVKKGKTITTTANYYVSKAGKNTLESSESARWVRIRSVSHPGMKAKPFLKPAYKKNKEQIIQIIGDAVMGVCRQAAKGAGK